MIRPVDSKISLFLLLLALVLPWAGALAASESGATPGDWIERYRVLAEEAGSACPPAVIPALPAATPVEAFSLADLAGTATQQPRVILVRDPIAERVVFLAQGSDGCVHAGASGRLLPFDARSRPSPFPNLILPDALGPVPPVVIISDAKSIRPWIEVVDELALQRITARFWLTLGAYTGMLLVLLLVGVGFISWQRSRLAVAYVVYIAILQLYQLQAFGLGPAWLPFWPGPEHGRLMQALAVALVVPAITGMVVVFLDARGLMRWLIIAGSGLSSLGFLASTWSDLGYRVGAAVVTVVALLTLVLLLMRLRSRDVSIRWFALGLAATITGGIAQALAILSDGDGLPGAASMAFLPGTVVESLCWAIALAVRFRSERLAMQNQLVYDATHDPLTGTFGRAYLRDRIADVLASARLDPLTRVGLLFIDLDGFKRINDTLGHAAGDRVLCAVAQAIEQLNLDSNCIGRFGGDEFLVLIRPGAHWSVTEGAAAAVVARFADPIPVDGSDVEVRASVGVVAITGGYDNVDAVVHDADVALYVAKHRGGAIAVPFEPHMTRDAQARARLRSELALAVDNGQLLLHFQPILDLEEMRTVGLEALVRWRHPERGIIDAADFLPFAEEGRLMRRLGGVVIDLAFRQIEAWRAAGLWREGAYLSINVSGQQVMDDNLIEQLDQALDSHAVEPGNIRIELSESLLCAQPDLARRFLPRLLGRRVLLCVDNFGTGLTPLTLLTEIEPDLIKIDASVTGGIAHRGRSQSLAAAALLLGGQLGALVVAEGIETPEQLEHLRAMGLKYGQGRLLAPPMSAEQIVPWLELWPGRVHDATEAGSGERLH